MLKEYHLVIDNSKCKYLTDYVYTNIYDTCNSVVLNEIVYSTQPHFLSFSFAKRLFIHINNKIYEIKLGKNTITDRIIKKHTNIENLLYGGEFKFE